MKFSFRPATGDDGDFFRRMKDVMPKTRGQVERAIRELEAEIARG